MASIVPTGSLVQHHIAMCFEIVLGYDEMRIWEYVVYPPDCESSLWCGHRTTMGTKMLWKPNGDNVGGPSSHHANKGCHARSATT